MSIKNRSTVRTIPDDIISRQHDDSAPCLGCAVTLAINAFTAEQAGTIDPDMVIDDLGDLLAQWIAALDDPKYRDYTADVPGEILKRRVKHCRAIGQYPGSEGTMH